jgi:hypothetical protein
MSNYRFDLLFLEPPTDSIPCPTIAHVALKTWSTQGYKGYEDVPIVSTQAISKREFDHQIEELIGELRSIQKAAHRKFDKAEATTMKNVEARIAARKALEN